MKSIHNGILPKSEKSSKLKSFQKLSFFTDYQKSTNPMIKKSRRQRP